MKRSAGLAALLAFVALHAGPSAFALDVNATGLHVEAPAIATAQGLQLAAQTSANLSTDPAAGPADHGFDVQPQSVAPPEAMEPATTAGTAAIAAAGTAVGLGLLVYYWAQLKAWIAGGALALFSRIEHNRILDNEVRGRIHEAITQNPGITIKEVTTVCQVGWGTAVYHLKRLELERLIVSERHRQFRRFFKNGGVVNEDKSAYAELKNPTAQRLAARLLETPGAAQKELCEAVGISAPLAHKYLDRMERAQLLTKHREWKLVKYFPTDRLADLMPQAEPLAISA